MIVRSYYNIVQDLLFNKHRLRDMQELKDRGVVWAPHLIGTPEIHVGYTIAQLEKKKAELIAELLYEDKAAQYERLCLSCKPVLTDEDKARLRELSKPHP